MQRKNNIRGYTFIEVLVCIIILMIMVEPCYKLLHRCMQTRAQADQIREGNLIAEKLASAVKDQMEIDLEGLLLQEGDEIMPRKQSFESFFKGLDEKELESQYHLEKYACEIYIQEMDEKLMGKGQLSISQSSLKEGYCILSDVTIDEVDEEVEIQVTSEMIELIKEKLNAQKNYSYQGGKAVKISDVFEAYLSSEGIVVTQNQELLKIDTMSWFEENGEIIQGYCLTYAGKDENNASADEASIINLDVALSEMQEKIVLEIENNSDSNLIIKIRGKDTEKVSIKTKDTGIGQSLMIWGGNHIINHDFLMVIVIRDKEPTYGKKGKVIKKMIDWYAYEQIK